MASKDARGRGGGRGFTLAILAIGVAVLAAWLGDCLPGLGGGGGGAPAPEGSSPPPAPAEQKAEPAENDEPQGTIEIAVQGEECRRGDEAPVQCPALCDALPTEGVKERRVVVDATLGTHAAVEALRACLRDAGFTQVVVRTE